MGARLSSGRPGAGRDRRLIFIEKLMREHREKLKQLDHIASLHELATKTVQDAERIADSLVEDTKRAAERESSRIIEEARTRARELLQKAESAAHNYDEAARKEVTQAGAEYLSTARQRLADIKRAVNDVKDALTLHRQAPISERPVPRRIRQSGRATREGAFRTGARTASYARYRSSSTELPVQRPINFIPSGINARIFPILFISIAALSSQTNRLKFTSRQARVFRSCQFPSLPRTIHVVYPANLLGPKPRSIPLDSSVFTRRRHGFHATASADDDAPIWIRTLHDYPHAIIRRGRLKSFGVSKPPTSSATKGCLTPCATYKQYVKCDQSV